MANELARGDAHVNTAESFGGSETIVDSFQGVVFDGVETSGTFAQSDVGTAIAVSTSMTISGADVANYTLLQPADLVANITAAELTVTADDKSREACAANPDFTFTYSGFVGSDDEGVIPTPPTI